MKHDITPQRKPRETSKGLLVMYRTAVTLVLVLFGVLAVGSLYALMRPSDSGPLLYLGRQGDHAVGQGSGSGGWRDSGPVGVFSGIGRLRIPLAGVPPATVVLSLSFSYPADDLFFAEELATRVGEFRSIAVGYFSSFSREDIARLDETQARNEILARYNALLHLGRIETLYFTDLLVIESP